MKKIICVALLAVIACSVFAQFGQPKKIQSVEVESKKLDAFVEELEGLMGVAIGSALSLDDAKKYDRYKEKNGTYYVSGLKKLEFALSRYCYIEREKFSKSYVAGYWIKADNHKCLEVDLMEKLCGMTGNAYDSEVGYDGFVVKDKNKERKIDVNIERGSGCYYLVTIKCDDVGKFLSDDDVAEEGDIKVAIAEKENAEKKAKADADAKKVADEKDAVELDSSKTKLFNAAIVDSLSNRRTCIESVGVDFPVKSLCGFKLGATIEESLKLVKDGKCDLPDWARVEGAALVYKGKLVKPFRKFTDVALKFCGRAGLQEIRLRGKVSSENYSKEDIQTELSNIIMMMEKKFEIKMKVLRDVHGIDSAEWVHKQKLPVGMRKQFLNDKVDPDEYWISPRREEECSIERIFLNDIRDEGEMSLTLGSSFLMNYSKLLKWRVNHKAMSKSDEGFDDL